MLDAFTLQSGSELSRSGRRLIAPRLEAEIAFVVGKRVAGPGVTLTRALAAIQAIVPALEIVDSRIVDWRLRMPDAIADNGAAAGAVVGDSLGPATGLELPTLGIVLERDGKIVGSGSGAAVLGHPARALIWLANALGVAGEALMPAS